MMTCKRTAAAAFCLQFLTAFLLMHPPDARPDESALSAETEACLSCHGNRGIEFQFQNQDSAEAYVNADEFRASVHASLSCSACHADFSGENHPKRTFRSKSHYAVKSALACRQCHSDEQLKRSSIHASLLSAGNSTPVCTSCHSAHAVQIVSAASRSSSEKQYCLGCHKHGIAMTLRNGDTLKLAIDIKRLESSVHAKLSCYDCHFGFTSAQHPRRSFRDPRQFSITQSEACRRCHFDKYTKTIESIHYSMLSQGNLEAPVCTDCHGAHGIGLAGLDKPTGAMRCGRCHDQIYQIYASSIHGSALLNEHNTDVPVCISCHTAHTIEDARTTDYRDKVPEICGACHSDRTIMDKYGLNTGVVNSYLQDFHGITLGFYRQQKELFGADQTRRKNIATCTDCHGIHDISKASGSNTKLVKANIVKRCQKCHPGATEEFPDAWLSHYEPTLASAPLVFIINFAYKFFIPFMLIGLALQILLHFWRYAVNR